MAAPVGSQGIYKITSPSGRVYVGQSLDIRVRFAKYRLLHCQGQIRLYNSFIRYGVDSHRFEIIEVCDEESMNERERHYQDMYEVIGARGLNCKLTAFGEVKGRHSVETKAKIAKAHTGRHHSEETLEKMRLAKRGKKMPEEQRLKMIGRKAPKGVPEKLRQRMMGNTYTKGITPPNARKVVCEISGAVFNKVSDAAEAIGVKRSTLAAMLRGENRNRTSLRYV